MSSQPITSILAHESVKPSKQHMYLKIAEGLEKLKVGGTFYQIAEAAGLRPEQVAKRNSEMEKLGIIFNTGTMRQGNSGRLCTVWQLTVFSEKKPTFISENLSQGNLF